MQAIRVRQFGGPEVLTLEETPTPVPSAGQALVGMGAAGVKPVDTYIRAGACARPIDPRLGRSRHRRICRPGASHTSNPANATTAAAPSPAPTPPTPSPMPPHNSNPSQTTSPTSPARGSSSPNTPRTTAATSSVETRCWYTAPPAASAWRRCGVEGLRRAGKSPLPGRWPGWNYS